MRAPPPGPQPTPQPTPAPAPAFGAQVGSFRTEAEARREWERLQRRHPDQFGGRTARVVPADLGARGVFHRVHVLARTAGEAQALCRAVKPRGVDCLVLKLP